MIDLHRMNINKVMKKVEREQDSAKRKARNEDEAFRLRHRAWVDGVTNEMLSLRDLLFSEIHFTNKSTLHNYLTEIDTKLESIDLDENAKYFLRGHLLFKFTAFPVNKLSDEQVTSAHEMIDVSRAKIMLYSIPQLSALYDQVTSYAYWKKYHEEEMIRICKGGDNASH